MVTTEFVANHPGGSDKIMMAAGKAIDPFWNLYRQHLNRCDGATLPTDDAGKHASSSYAQHKTAWAALASLQRVSTLCVWAREAVGVWVGRR